MTTIEDLQKEIENIKRRNKSVELDKRWETSYARRIALMICTYLILGIYMQAVNIPHPWLNSIVPTVGFLLSTFTLPIFKKLWVKYIYKK
ncbi:hypothetical protein KAU19_02430 [Candidatus Parcubacteria bacterium]|nr:hypothetical protein [Candidatus Parcubacteria bacterium]